MLKALKFILIAALLLALAWWVASLPGTVTANAGPYTIQTSTPAALLILFLIALLFTIILRVLGGLRATPAGISTWNTSRREKLGNIATQRAFTALAAADAPAARTESNRARKLLGDTPITLLLTAESARLAGRPDDAKAAFALLTKQKDAAFLGHHGLLRHAMESGDHDAAHDHALNATDAYPGSPALQSQRLALAVKREDWRAALSLTKNPAEIAALATAAARAAPDYRAALAYARQAIRAAPTLAPAVVAYAAALRAAGKPRAANRALRDGWKIAPHPLLATAFLEPIPTPIERAQAAQDLAAANPSSPASERLLAETALAARLTGEARRHAQAAGPAGAHILATLDSKPATPPATALWECTACHATQPDWSPVCPNCQTLGTLQPQP